MTRCRGNSNVCCSWRIDRAKCGGYGSAVPLPRAGGVAPGMAARVGVRTPRSEDPRATSTLASRAVQELQNKPRGEGGGTVGRGNQTRDESVMMQQRSVHVPAAAAAAAATLESQHSIRQLQRKQQPLSQQQMLVQPRQELALPPRLALSATYSAIRVSSCAWWSLRSCVASVTMRTCVIHATSAPLQRAIEEGKKRERKKEGVEVKESALTSDTT